MKWAVNTFTLFLEGELSLPAAGFHCDENCSKSLVKLLRSHGLDVTSAHQAGLCRQGDKAHLPYASLSRRVVVTHDVKDFLRLGGEMKHAGILLERLGLDVPELEVGKLLPRHEPVDEVEQVLVLPAFSHGRREVHIHVVPCQVDILIAGRDLTDFLETR